MPFISPTLPLSSARQHQRKICRCALDADVVVVGGGVGGLAVARALKRIGRDVTIFERDTADAPAGQAVGLWTNAWQALGALNVDMTQLRESIRCKSAKIVRARDGTQLASVKIPNTTEFRYVEREQLVDALLDDSKVNVQYGARVESVILKQDSPTTTVTISGGEEVRARLVIGADGIRSVVRSSLGMENSIRNAKYRAWRGSATVKRGEVESLGEGQILQIWGVGERVGVTRVREDLLHWFYTGVKCVGDNGFGSDEEELEYVRQRVQNWGCEVAREVVTLPQRAFTVTRCGDRLMWSPTFGKGAVTLLGDAAHLSTPNLGQGAALALEDAVEIAYRLGKSGGSGRDDVEALRAYERARWARNLNVGVRSAAAGVVAHLSTPPLVGLRNSVVVPIVLSEKILLSGTYWQPRSF